jgi:hypothetical protein
MSRVKTPYTAWLVGAALAAAVSCSDQPGGVPQGWVATGDHAAFPAPLTVAKATAITIDGTYIYWITTDGFLYRAPRAGGGIDRLLLPAPGQLLNAHNDVFVGWTDSSGNAAIADIDPPTGKVLAVNHQPGALRGMIGGQRGYSFAVATHDGTAVQACRDGMCTQLLNIPSQFKSLANDFPTNTFYVLTADGLRTCTLMGGCPAQAATVPNASALVAALPGTYYLLDSNGQASGTGGSPNLGSPAASHPTKLVVVDGNGHTTDPVGTWSNGSQLAQTLLTPSATTAQLANACTDFEVDATGRPLYCLAGSSQIQIIP